MIDRLVVDAVHVGKRLDRFLAASFPRLSRTQIQQRIHDGAVRVDGCAAKPALALRLGQVVEVDPEPTPPPSTVEPQEIPLSVLFEDESLLVIDKPAGLVVHPAPGNWAGTLVNALLHHWGGSRAGLDTLRPGIVHRLDKDTSGVLVIAKDAETLARLAGQFQDRSVEKRYVALVAGAPPKDRGVMREPIGRHPVLRKQMAVRPGGRTAETHYEVVERFRGAALVRLTPRTGRTHQLRVHLAALGHPILGDSVYGRGRKGVPLLGRQALHAEQLGFRHPRTEAWMTFRAPLPSDMEAAVHELRLAKNP